MTSEPKPEAPPAEREAEPPAALPPRLRSEQLFGAANEVLIEHRGATYRLKRTSLGKLILTK